ncbi:MAG TPA: hypothetical protein VG123_03150 [Streptosporangiaceae bacterium]|nr:hypothetical protein [Streptosporangiaceae bacterium]
MTTQLPYQRSRHSMAARQAGARLGRPATVLAAVIAGLLASVTAATAAFANPIQVGDGGGPVTPVPATTVRVISTGGMAGWQITLIAAAAALAAATAAVILERARASRRAASATG